MPSPASNTPQPVSFERKSKCHHERRNSPSVASFKPVEACLCTTFSISMSSALRRSSADISPFSSLARASLLRGGRNRLPTSSARKGALVLCMVFTPANYSFLTTAFRSVIARSVSHEAIQFLDIAGLLRSARKDDRRYCHDLPATPR